MKRGGQRLCKSALFIWKCRRLHPFVPCFYISYIWSVKKLKQQKKKKKSWAEGGMQSGLQSKQEEHAVKSGLSGTPCENEVCKLDARRESADLIADLSF